MNRVVLMGRLTRDPDVRYTQGQDEMCIARYTLAVDRRRSRNQEGQQADFISCVAFGKSGEWAEKWLHKGTKIVIAGHIQTGSYTNKDGQKVYTTDVVVDDQEFAESKNSAPESNQQSSDEDMQRRWNAANGTAMGYKDRPSEGGFMDIPDGIDEELPFN